MDPRPEGACLPSLAHQRCAPARRADQRYTFAYLFGAVEPGTDNAFALIMPEVSTQTMQAWLDSFAETVASDEHVLMVLDQAGGMGRRA